MTYWKQMEDIMWQSQQKSEMHRNSLLALVHFSRKGLFRTEG